MDIERELSANPALLLVLPSVNYTPEIMRIVKRLSGRKLCYITLNKTHEMLADLFKQEGIDTGRIVFIDAVSSSIKSTPEAVENCHFTSQPGDMTQIAILFSKLQGAGFDCVVFDSITNLAVYETNERTIIRFVMNLASMMRKNRMRAVFCAANAAKHASLIASCSTIVDKVIDQSGKASR